MAVTCPYCQNSLSIQKNLKAGKYAPSCPKCTRKVQVIIPEEPGQPIIVRAIKGEREKGITVPGPSDPNKASLKQHQSDEPHEVSTGLKPTTPDPKLHGSRPIAPPIAETLDLSAEPEEPKSPAALNPSDIDTAIAAAPAAPSVEPMSADVPGSLGGYQVVKELGQGGMGAVYLARQLSLNRSVALKVMKPKWASNPTFVARFTREAYAAAQLTHHNVVQIYDFGEDKGTTYFSMEFVDGQTLSGLLKQKKRLDPEEAAGYILQAARGLKFAHDQSMIHRDIKPDNLLLNQQGIVKVADLGLVKTPDPPEAFASGRVDTASGPRAVDWPSAAGSSNITMAQSAMGTPAYMAPEQAQDASGVDLRADIYSLGCTFYAMVTGRPPFEGKTVVEILSKHKSEPVTPPELVAKRVPKSVSEIILKMTAKKPDDRYPDLGAVTKDLEKFLGVAGSGPFTPREEHANLLEAGVQDFNAAPTAKVRALILPILFGACLFLAVVSAFVSTNKLNWLAGFLGLGLVTVLADFVICGIRRKTYLFQKVRELAFKSTIGDWLFAIFAVVIFAGLLYVLGLFWIGLVVSVVGILLAIGIDAAIGRKLDAERQEPIARIEGMLRTLRLNGLSEDSIRQFVCKYSGDNWEESYEALFGYEAKIQARERWGRGDGARARPRFGIWRDPLVAWIDAKLRKRQEAKDVATLQKIEEKSLQSQGENLVTARRKAKRSAEAMVVTAGEMKETMRKGGPQAASNRKLARAMAEAAARPDNVLAGKDRDRARRGSSDLVGMLLGPRIRFIAGALLLAACATWMHQNGVISTNQGQALIDVAKTVAKTGDVNALQDRAQAELEKSMKRDQRTKKQDLKVAGLPAPLLKLLSTYGAGVAGLILIFSSLFQGTRIALFAIPAAAIPIFAPGGLPEIPYVDPSLAPSAVGAAIMAAGVLFGRGRT